MLHWAGAMDAALAEAAQECFVPADFATTVLGLGSFTVDTFARIASSEEACDFKNCFWRLLGLRAG